MTTENRCNKMFSINCRVIQLVIETTRLYDRERENFLQFFGEEVWDFSRLSKTNIAQNSSAVETGITSIRLTIKKS